MRTNKRTFPGAELKPVGLVAPLDLAAVFPRGAPLEVDLGCGDGTFLIARARAHPERDFLGVEQMAGRVRSACRRIGAHGLTNARILRLEILHALTLLPPASVEVCHLLFPDPWPKRRHQERRIVTRDFLRAVRRVLQKNGTLRIKTDQPEYFATMEEVVRNSKELSVVELNPETDAPLTTFEQRFLEEGLPIHRLVLRKLSDGR